ncbi:FAD-binding oxidoreductase [Thermomonospora umbrina]|uniref:FAD/FMN-containing dehydrogenase n=1 Tax=Thermomonospora umbrina TaxID=111806 RepID=A0A3D9SV43_9ACTN|nr:FAD-binding oxidoreductase [Thermomonospora umbrina]REE99658.1 FAD/FMN-containing dehydrogenase [Thermomonospora umbrina]
MASNTPSPDDRAGDPPAGWSRRRLMAGAAVLAGASVPAVASARTAAGAVETVETAPFPPVSVRSGDARYPDLVRGMNQRWTARPESVQLVASTEQVRAAVQQAVDAGKRLTVRGGGHCYEDFVFNDAVETVIDLSEMTAVRFDEQRGAFEVQAGATLTDVYERLYKAYGVVVPGGVCYSVGVGGHVSGGGWGMLCRRNGLIVDHLYAVEVVVVDARRQARAVIATRESSDPNRELWWAHTGGGGGNFGVVTRYWFRSPGATGTTPGSLLPRPPAEVLLSAVSWPWEDMTEQAVTRLVRNYGAWHESHATAGGPYDGLVANLSLNHRSNGQIGLLTQMDATVPDAQGLLDAFLRAVSDGVGVPHGAVTKAMGEFGPMPEFATPQRLPWLQATRYLGVTNSILVDPTLRGDYKSAYLRRNIPEQQIATMYRHLTRTDFANPNAMVLLSSYGAAVNSVSRTATASVHRDSAFKLLYQTYWHSAGEDAANLAWLRGIYEDVYAATGGVPVSDQNTDGCYVNYPDIDLNDPLRNRSGVPWSTLYYGENYPRLQRVKAAWDPADVFRHGQSVRLPR